VIDFHAAHHSRAGLCAVSTGGVSLFNADRPADPWLKPEIGPACHDANRRAQFAHPAGQGSTAQPGGRRHFQRSGIRDQTGVLETLPGASNTDEVCLKGMGSFRLASQTGEPYTTRPAAPFSISALFHGANSFAYPFPNPSERIEDAQRQARMFG